MLGSQLKRLASVADLSASDLDSKAGRLGLSTSYVPGSLAAHYIGSYTAGCCWLERDLSVPEVEVELGAAQFKTLVGLFADDEDVQIKADAKAIRLITGGPKLRITSFAPEDRLLDLVDADIRPLAQVPLAELRREVAQAQPFVASSLALPCLQGVRFSVAAGALRLVASNGSSMVYTASITCDTQADGVHTILAPADLLRGLRLFDGETVEWCTANDGRIVLIRDDSGWLRVATLSGAKWPDLEPLRRPATRTPITISADQILGAGTAIKACATENYIEIAGNGSGTLLKTPVGEAGQYVTSVDGAIEGSYWYSGDDLVKAGKIGSDLTLDIATDGSNATTIVRGDHSRRIWLASRTRPVGQ